jgi:hypothetical protein
MAHRSSNQRAQLLTDKTANPGILMVICMSGPVAPEDRQAKAWLAWRIESLALAAAAGAPQPAPELGSCLASMVGLQ